METQIIPRIAPSWQKALAEMITDPEELFALLALDGNYLPAAQAAVKLFPLRVTRDFVSRITKNNMADPLLRQILPLGIEAEETPDFSEDPLAEKENQYNPIPGLLHKYKNRVLLTVTGACAIHCRYCFRRHFPYEENNPGTLGWEKALNYIATHPEINEVILSGGDPLMLTDPHLKSLIEKISAISTVQRLRLHTRLPIVLPTRITKDLINALTQTRLQPIIIIHCNHAQEIDAAVKTAIEALRSAHIILFNQAVLLRGVNDTVTAQINLADRSFAIGIIPYYLHLLDKVKGAAHFEVSEKERIHLINTMRSELSGYLMPRVVCEVPGELSKVLIS